jgi:acetyltransferase
MHPVLQDEAARDIPERTWTIRRYPTQLIDRWALEDGRVVTIRPILPQDDALAQEFVRALSVESRYNRFLVGLAELSAPLLSYLTDIDYIDHLALVAETQVYGRMLLVGEARFVVDARSGAVPHSADFAIAVADDWQAAGIGSRLLRNLESAASAAGIVLLTGDVLGSNHKALDFMRQRGFSTHTNRDEPRLMRVEKLVAADAVSAARPEG